METQTLELSAPEGAVALATLVAFSDDDPSEAEGVILRKYYRYSTAESLQRKLTEAGFQYPTDLPSAEKSIVRAIGSAPRAFRLRTVAVAWALALADGKVDQGELRVLSRYAEALGVGLAEARARAESGVPEIDESTSGEQEEAAAPDDDTTDTVETTIPDLSPVEAGIALACWTGFADDEPTDAEVAVVREHFPAMEVEGFLQRLDELGLEYPAVLPQLESAILASLRQLARDEQLRLLAIADRVARADGVVNADEEDIVKRYCEELYIGLSEVRSFFRTSLV